MGRKNLFLWLVMLLSIIVIGNISILSLGEPEQKTLKVEKNPQSAMYEILDYNNYTATSNDAEYEIGWEYSSSNANVSITVVAMDNSAYSSFDYYVNDADYDLEQALEYVSQYYSLCSGFPVENNGTWDVPQQDTWYILFLNQDSDKESTELTYQVSWDPGEYDEYDPDLDLFFLFPIIFGSIVAILVVFFIVFGIVQYNKAKKKENYGKSFQRNPYRAQKEESARRAQRKRAQAQQLSVKPRKSAKKAKKQGEKKIKTINCRYCGEQIESDAEFCPWCGTRL
ncbi:MAG: DUF7575 domain-containing protein [Promethearchaeia archaeon]